MKIEIAQKEFLHREFFAMAWSAASQHNKIYRKDKKVSENKKTEFHKFMREILNSISEGYKKEIDEKQHVGNINGLKDKIEKNYDNLLKNSKITFGTCQKVLNVYLKYLWSLKEIATPPHCPIDSFVIKELRKKFSKISWTKIEERDYWDIIETIKEIAKGQSIAEWELIIFNDRQVAL